MSKAELLAAEEKELELWAMAHPEPTGEEEARLMVDLAAAEQADGPRRRAQSAYEFAWMVFYGWTTREKVLREYPSQVGEKDLDSALRWIEAEIEADMPEQ